MIRDIEVPLPVDGQGARETEHIKVIHSGLGCWNQPAVAHIAVDILLSQDDIHDGVGKRIAKAKDTVIVRIAQPYELSVAHWSYAMDRVFDSCGGVRAKYR